MKKKYILATVLTLLVLSIYEFIFDPIYRIYDDATHIESFAEDKKDVFIGTFDGLYKVNKKTNEIRKIKKNEFNYITKIVVDENDEKWVLTYQDLFSFKNENKVIKHHFPFNKDRPRFLNMAIDGFGRKWLFAETDFFTYELYMYNYGIWEKHPIPKKFSNGQNDYSIGRIDEEILIDKFNNRLFRTNKMYERPSQTRQHFTEVGFLNYILVFNYQFLAPEWDETWTLIPLETNKLQAFENQTYSNLFVDKGNNTWIEKIAGEKYTLYRFEYPDLIKYDDINREIKALDSDSNGKIWIASDEGIETLNDKKSFIPKKGINGKMYIDSNNKIWIDNYDAESLECYDGKEWKSYNYEIFKLVLKEFFSQLF